MRIGYCSPFNPMKSGISDFSEELVFALAEHVEIVIFSPVKPQKKELWDRFEIRMLSELDDEAVRNSLDLIVYHIGNNVSFHGEIVDMLAKYPGIVELHEIGVHNLVAAKILEQHGKEAYLNMVNFCHGKRGLEVARSFFDGVGGAPWIDHSIDMCMARPYIEQAKGIIVHAEMIKQMVLGIRSNIPIINIMLHSLDMVQDSKQFQAECRTKLKLDHKLLIMGSFGFATSAKRILPTLDALAKLKHKQDKFLYVLVGEVEKDIAIKKELEVRNLTENVIVTGFVSLEHFKLYMGACDFCLNLRYPTQGESSGSLHRMLGMGKPAIVTDVGTFGDYPDDVVLKVRYDDNEVEDIYQAVSLLLKNQNELKQRGEKALQFAREHCDLTKNAKIYAEFFRELKEGIWQPDYEDTIIERLCELGLTDEDYLKHIYDFAYAQ